MAEYASNEHEEHFARYYDISFMEFNCLVAHRIKMSREPLKFIVREVLLYVVPQN